MSTVRSYMYGNLKMNADHGDIKLVAWSVLMINFHWPNVRVVENSSKILCSVNDFWLR